LHAEAGRRPPIFGLHIHNRLTLNSSPFFSKSKRTLPRVFVPHPGGTGCWFVQRCRFVACVSVSDGSNLVCHRCVSDV